MMMGTADEIVKAPEKGPVFMEDLPEEEQVVSLVRFHDSLLCFTNVIGSCYYFSSLNLINGLWLSYGI